jgi:hypothetical protein
MTVTASVLYNIVECPGAWRSMRLATLAAAIR